MTAVGDARKREAERAERAVRVDTYIALDGASEPTLWREGHHDRPIALFRRCDVGEAGWAWIEAQFERMQRENRANLAAQDAHAAPVAPVSSSVAPESTASANGAQGANLTSDHAVVDALLACLPMHEDGTGHVVDCGYDENAMPSCGCYSLPERLAAIVREHRAEVLAEIERRLAERQDVGNRTGDYNGGLAGAIAIVRDYRQEQNR